MMITNALINAQIDGSIFSGNVRLFERTQTVNNFHTSYTFLVIPGSHINSLETENMNENDENVPEHNDIAPLIIHQPATSERNAETTSDAPSRSAPFSIMTTLQFTDSAISAFEKLDIGGIPLFVITRKSTRIQLPPQPEFLVIRQKGQCLLPRFQSWEPANHQSSHPMPTEFPLGKTTNLPNSVPKSQLWWGRDRNVSLYRLPKNKRLVIAGQEVIFSSMVFDNIYCTIIRKHERRNVFVRQLALIALPSTQPKGLSSDGTEDKS